MAYTLIKNPSIQQYTANNMALIAKQKELEQGKVFVLEHVIDNMKKEQEYSEKGRNEEGRGGAVVEKGGNMKETDRPVAMENGKNEQGMGYLRLEGGRSGEDAEKSAAVERETNEQETGE